MSRGTNITAAQRREWLERHDRGDTIAKISGAAGRDSRTVKAQIQKAAQEQEVRLARRDQIRHALDKHNIDLLNVARGLRDEVLALPNERFTPIAAFPRSNQLTFSWTGYVIDREELVVKPAIDSGLAKLERLFREHLRDERTLWRDIDRWRDSNRKYVEDCLLLGDAVANNFAEVTGLEPVQQGGSETGFHEAMVSWACRLAIEGAGLRGEGSVPEPTTVAGQLRLKGSTLATSDSSEQLDKACHAFLDHIDDQNRFPETRNIARLKRDLDQKGASIKDRVEDILLFEFISGKCAVCAKHSI